MNQFISNNKKFIFYYDIFKYEGNNYIRESHGGSGIHWHLQRIDGGKNWEIIHGELENELEKQYLRKKKFERVLKNNE